MIENQEKNASTCVSAQENEGNELRIRRERVTQESRLTARASDREQERGIQYRNLTYLEKRAGCKE